MNLSAQFKAYLSSQKKKPSDLTIKNYLADVNQFVSWHEKKGVTFKPHTVTHKTIQAYLNEKGLSSSSRERHMSSLKRFFTYLKDEKLVTDFPFPSSVSGQEPQDPFKLSDFTSHLLTNKASHLTVKNYKADIKHFTTWIANHHTSLGSKAAEASYFSLITNEKLEAYKNSLVNQNLSTQSINRKLSSLRRYLNWAHEQGMTKAEKVHIMNISKARSGVINEAVQNDNLTTQLPVAANNTDSLGIINPTQPVNDATRSDIELAQSKSIIAQDLGQITSSRAKPEQTQNTYSTFPPLRLLQKIKAGIVFAIDVTLIAAFAKTLEHLEYFRWLASGKQIFKASANNTLSYENSKNDHFSLRFISWMTTNVLQIAAIAYPEANAYSTDMKKHHKMFFHMRHTRPNWYKKYHQLPLVHYFHFAALIILMSAIGFMGYRAFFDDTGTSQAALPTAPPRVLSFQGRLTDNLDTPITSATSLRFALYDDLSASGSALLWQEVQTTTPDQDGIFSVLLGSETSIPDSVFRENSALYLGITVGTDSELIPRQQIATVAFAANSETLQGLEPITAAGAGTSNVVLALDSTGNLTIGGSATPTFEATGGQFTLAGDVLHLTTSAGTNSNVEINPDGIGIIDLQKPLQNTTENNNIDSAAGAVEVDDLFAVLATSSGQSAFTLNQDGAGPIISASSSGVARFTLSNNGTGYFAGNVGIGSTVPSYKLDVQGGSGVVGRFSGRVIGASAINSNEFVTLSQLNSGVSGSTFWQVNSGALSPINSTYDVLVGSTATSSALVKLGGTSGATSFFNTGGNVGIGTTSPANGFHAFSASNEGVRFESSSVSDTQLLLSNTAANRIWTLGIGGTSSVLGVPEDNFFIRDRNGGAIRMIINTVGNIGIGSTSPTQKLDVTGNANVSGTLYADTIQLTGACCGIGIDFNNENVTGLNDLTISDPGPTEGLHWGGSQAEIVVSPLDGSNTDGLLRLVNDEGISFEPGTKGTSAMTILANGNVGIGSVTPAYALDVVSGDAIAASFDGRVIGTAAVNSNEFVTLSQLDSEISGSTYWQVNSNALSPINSTYDVLVGGNATSSALIKLGGTSGAASFFNTGGNLGIGTTSPGALFSVRGSGSDIPVQISSSGGASGRPGLELVDPTATNYGSRIYFDDTANGMQIVGLTAGTEQSGIFVKRDDGNVGIGTTNAIQKLTLAGGFKLGDNSGTGQIDTSVWDITSAGVASGFTGLTSSGTITFSGLTASRAVFTTTGGQLTTTGTSADLAASLSNETGTGVAVFGTSPSITTALNTGSTSFNLINTTATTVNFAGASTALTIGATTGTTTIRNATTALTGNLNVNGTGNSYISGNVGIGTTSPSTHLQVNGTNPFSGTSVVNSAIAGTSNVSFVTTDAQGADIGAMLTLGGNRNTTGTNLGVFGGIRGGKQNSTDGDTAGYLGFYTLQAGVAFAERMRITNVGNVGIGSTAPAYQLDVVSGDAIAASFDGRVIGTAAVNSNEFVTLSQLTSGTGQYWTQSGGNLYPSTITDNVGIGTTTTSYKLDVNGTGRFTGALTLDTPATSTTHAVRADRTLTAGNGLTGGGNLTANRTFNVGAGSCITVAADTVGVTDTCVNATTVDGIDSGSFLRSDTSDNYTSGTLTFDAGTTLDINGDLAISDTDIAFDGASTNFTTTGNFSINSSQFFINQSTGYVGLGTTSPSSKLSLVSDGTVANLFDITDNGSTIFQVTQSNITANVPAQFNAAGDVSIAYDLNFTNPTASYIKSSAPLYMTAGEAFNSSDLTLRTYNSGNVVIDSQALSVTGSATVSGELTLENKTTNGGLLYTNGSGVVAQTGAGTSSQCLLGGTTPTWGACSAGGGITGSGTLNYLPKFTPDGSTLGNSSIYDNGNIGIGTTTPLAKLQVAGFGTFGTAFTPSATESENIINILAGVNANGATNGIAFYEATNGFGMKLGYDGTGSGATNALRFYNDADAAIATIENGGNVGIGSTAPTAKLDVSGDIALGTGGGTPTISFRGSASTNILYKIGTNVLGSDARLRVMGGTVGAPAFSFVSDFDTGLYNPSADTLSLVTAGSDRLWIASDGNVGIGTSSPTGKLHLSNTAAGATSTLLKLTNASTSTNTGTRIVFNISDGATVHNAAIDALRTNTPNAHATALTFSTCAGSCTVAANLAERMRIDAVGNVGIGTTNPIQLFAVGSGSPFQVNATGDTKTSTLALGSASIAPTDRLLNAITSQAVTNATTYNSVFSTTKTGSLTGNASSIGTYNSLTNSASDGQYLHTTYNNYNFSQLSDGSTVDTQYGIYSQVQSNSTTLSSDTSTTATTSAGIRTLAFNNASGVITAQYGGWFDSYNNSTGSVANAYGSFSRAYANAGTITNGYGVYAHAFNNGGTITNSYGVYIADGSGTNNWGLYQVGATDKNYFAGNVGIGSTSPAYKLDVSGGTGIVGQFSGRVIGASAVNSNEFVTLSQLTSGTGQYWSRTGSNLYPTTLTDNVGIGTSSPVGKLALYSSTDVTAAATTANDYALNIWNPTATTGQQQGIAFTITTTANGTTPGAAINAERRGAWSLADLVFKTKGAATQTGDLLERMRITSNGNIGIGSTSPGEKLDVNGNVLVSGGRPVTIDSTNGQISIKGSSGGWAEGYFFEGNAGTDLGGFGAYGSIDALNYYYIGAGYTDTVARFYPNKNATFDGNVGIGTTTTTEKLTISGGNIQLDNNYSIKSKTTTGSFVNILTYTSGNLTRVGANTEIELGGYVAFRPAGTETGRITSTGNVGIGTTTPQTKLHIQESAVVGTTYSVTDSLTLERNGSMNINLISNTTGSSALLFSDTTRAQGFLRYDHATDKLEIQTAGAIRSVLDSSGNLGVGTTSPGTKLDVVGDIRTTGDVFLSSTTLDYSGSTTAQKEQRTQVSVTGAGWYRVAHIDGQAGRGQNTVTLYTTGGSYTPRSTTIRWFHDWSATAGISVISEAASGYWTDARVTNDGTNSYLEVYFTAAVDPLYLSMQYDGGYARGDLYTGTLVAGAGTVNATAKLGLFAIGSDKFSIDSSGNVGIGSTSPAYKLDVSGGTGIVGQFSGRVIGADAVNSNEFATLGQISGGAGQYWQRANGTLSPTNITDDVLIGGTANATSSALIRFGGTSGANSFFNTGGNVGIGSTSPGAKLDVAGTGLFDDLLGITGTNGTTNLIGHQISFSRNSFNYITASDALGALSFRTGGNNDRLTIREDGNVGIATTTPGARLHVNLGSNEIAQFNNGSNASGVTFVNGSLLGQNSQFQIAAVSTVPISFYTGATRNSMTPGTERMRLSSAGGLSLGNGYVATDPGAGSLVVQGNVGIGTTSPSFKLDVRGSSATTLGALNLQNTNTTAGAETVLNMTVFNGASGLQLRQSANATGPSWAIGSYDSIIRTGQSGSYLHLAAGASNNPQMTINPSGNVGIGTTSPDANLQVNGNSNTVYNLHLTNAGGAATGLLINGGNSGNDSSLLRIASYDNATPFFTVTDGNSYFQNGNVGIGTTSPNALLAVNGHSYLKTISQGYDTDERFYPNVVSQNQNTTVNGAWIIHTPLPRAGSDMVRIRVHGYIYGNHESVDFTIVGYTYSGTTGNVDGQTGGIVNYSLQDNGTDGRSKYVGVDANGNMAIALGEITDSTYYGRLSVDAWITNETTDYSTGWSIDQNTTAGFGWLDKKGPLTSDLKDTLYITSTGDMGIGDSTPSYKLDLNGTFRATGQTTLSNYTTNGGLLYTNGSGVVAQTGAGTSSQCLLGGTTPTWGSCSAGGGITGSGTTNYITKFTSAGTVGNSSIYDNGNVGIGTTNPSGALVDIANGTNALRLRAGNSSGASTNNQILMSYSSGTSYTHAIKTRHNSAGLSGNAIDFYVWDQTTDAIGTVGTKHVLTLDGTGNVGIGTTTPTQKLQVIGSIDASVQFLGNASDSVSAPSFSWTGDTNVGMFRPATDTLGFTTGGTERMRITSNGNVGIGGTAPTSRLQIGTDTVLQQWSGSTPYVLIQGVDNEAETMALQIKDENQVELFRVSTLADAGATGGKAYFGGNVGIGTTSPGQLFDINGAGANLRIRGNTSSGTRGYLTQAGTATYLTHNASFTGTATDFAPDSTTVGASSIQLDRGHIAFRTAPATLANPIAWTEAMRIDSTGNVGIGTTAPGATLDVVGGAGGVNIASFGRTSGATAHIALHASSGDPTAVFSYNGTNRYALGYDASNGSFNISENAILGTNDRFVIKSGNVGIGTTAPGIEFQVNVGNDSTPTLGSAVGGFALTSANHAYGMYAGVSLNGNTWFQSQRNDANTTTYSLLFNPSGGNVGVGTLTPGARLDVSGNIRTNGDLQIFNGATQVGQISAADTTWLRINQNVVKNIYTPQGFRADGGISSGNYALAANEVRADIFRGQNSSYYVRPSNTTTAGLFAGNVGIGTTSPSKLLALSGGIASENGYNLQTGGTDNMLVNGDFEQGGTYGWTGVDTVVTGGYAGNFAGQTTGSQSVESEDYIPVDPTRDVIQLEGYFKKTVAGTDPGLIYFGYKAYDANKTVITTAPCGAYCYFAASGYTLPVDGTWHKFSATTTGEGTSYPNFPVGTKFIRVLVLINYSASADSVTQMDHVSVKKINNGPLFVGNNFASTNMEDEFQTTKLYTNSGDDFVIEPPTGGHVLPASDSTFDFGSNTVRWANGYFDTLYGDGSNLTGINGLSQWDDVTGGINYAGGNVGIGTTSPTARLEITEDGTNPGLRINHGGTNLYASIQGPIFRDLRFVLQDNGSTDNFGFWTNNGGASAERVRIQANGNVGIGSTAPTQKLDVAGTARAGNFMLTAAAGNGIGFWNGAPSTYGIFMSNSATYQYGDVTDYYIANVMSSGTGRGFVWSYGGSPSMALNANSGNLAMKGTLTVNGTGNSSIAGNLGIGTATPTLGKLHVNGMIAATSGFGINYGGSYKTYEKSYSVNTATPATLVDDSGTAFDVNKSYKVQAVVSATGTQTGATAFFYGNGTAFTLYKSFEAGTSSNHIEFYLDAGVPKVRLYGHATLYNVSVLTEEMTNKGRGGSENFIYADASGNLTTSGNVLPSTDSTYNLGSNSVRWANGYFDTLYGDGSNLTGITAGSVSFANITSGTNTTAAMTLGAGSSLTAATGVTITGNSGSTFDINGDLAIADTSIAFDGASTNFTTSGNFSLNTNQLFVNQTTGNLGIGTTAPESKLEIYSPTQTITGNVSGNAQANLALMSSDSLAADKGGTLGFGGKYTSAGSDILFGAIAGRKANATSGSADGYLSFHVWNGSSGLLERMRIDTNGNIGIGTTAPVAELDIASGSMLFNNTDYAGVYFGSVFKDAAAHSGAWGYIRQTAANGQIEIGSDANVDFYETDGRTLRSSFDLNTGTFSFNGTLQAMNSNGLGIADDAGTVGLWVEDGANVGIGTTNPGAKLEVVGTTYLVGQTKEYFAGRETRTYRNVAQYNIDAATQTGTVKIAIPTAKNNSATMQVIKITGFNYLDDGGAWEAIVSGYNYTSGWVNTSAEIRGSAPFTSVRLGTDGTTDVILLGNTTTVWQYPQIFIDTVHAGYSNEEGFDDTWTISMITDETGITVEKTPNIKTYIATNGNMGIGTTSPSYKLDVSGTGRFTGNLDANAGIDITSGDLTLGSAGQVDFADEVGDKLNLYSTSYGIGIESGTLTNWSGGAFRWRVGGTSVSTGTERMVLDSAGNLQIDGALTSSGVDLGLALGSVVFEGASGLTQDNANFYWDDSNNRLGIGTNAPSYGIAVAGAGVNGSVAANQFVDHDNPSYYLDPASTAIALATYGNIEAGATTKNTDTAIRVLADDSHMAGFEAYGSSQGTGYFFAGQSSSYGGGIFYNGDGTPDFSADELADRVTFFRRDAGVNHSVFHYVYNSDEVVFEGNINATGAYELNGTAGITQGTAACVTTSGGIVTGTGSCPGAGAITGSGTDNYLARFNGTGAIETSSIYDNGNIGIGTTSPAAKLDIADNSGLRISGWGGFAQTYSAASIVLGSNVYVNPADTVSRQVRYINTHGSYGHAYAEFYGGDVVFNAASGATTANAIVTPAERLRIVGSSGNVGIGTNNPEQKLHVAGSIHMPSGESLWIRNNGGTGDAGQRLRVHMASGGDSYFDTSDDLYFRSGILSSVSTMTILTDGNVGIGTTTPTEKLEVNGAIKLPAASTTDNDARGITYLSNDDFLYDSEYINHYGFGFHNFGGGISSYMVGYYGLDFFSAGAIRMRIDQAGNIGIGSQVTSPTAKLDVYGDIKLGNTANRWRMYTMDDRDYPSECDGAGSAAPFNDVLCFNSSEDAAAEMSIDHNGWLAVDSGLDTGNDPDIAEHFPVNDQSINRGDILVATDPAGMNKNRNIDNVLLTKASLPYQPGIIGGVSSDPSILLGTEGAVGGDDRVINGDMRAVALAGRIPMKVSTINGPIKAGDNITTSSIPGVGMKATKAGYTVGRALQAFNGTAGKHAEVIPCPEGTPAGVVCGKIIVFMNVSWADPEIQIAESGNLTITGTDAGSFKAWAGQYNFERKAGFADAVIARLVAGITTTQQLVVNGQTQLLGTVKVGTQTLQQYILSVVQNAGFTNNSNGVTSPIASIDKVNTDVISPLSQNQVTIDGNASVSGTLRAKKIVADEIEGLDAKIASLSAGTVTATQAAITNITNITNVYNTASNSAQPTASNSAETEVATDSADIATDSADMTEDFTDSEIQTEYMDLASSSAALAYTPTLSSEFATFTKGLMSFGPSTFSDAAVTGQLSVNGSLIIAANSINTLGGTLEIQPLAQGDISFMSGLMTLDTEGNLNVAGNAYFAKDVTVKGTLAANIISPVPSEDLIIRLPSMLADGPNRDSKLVIQNASGSGVLEITNKGDLTASGAGTFAQVKTDSFQIIRGAQADISATQTVASSSAGVATIKANYTERTIQSEFVTEDSLIYLTPVGSTNGLAPYVARQTASDPENGVKGSFTIQIPARAITDMKINWFIVN